MKGCLNHSEFDHDVVLQSQRSGVYITCKPMLKSYNEHAKKYYC